MLLYMGLYSHSAYAIEEGGTAPLRRPSFDATQTFRGVSITRPARALQTPKESLARRRNAGPMKIPSFPHFVLSFFIIFGHISFLFRSRHARHLFGHTIPQCRPFQCSVLSYDRQQMTLRVI